MRNLKKSFATLALATSIALTPIAAQAQCLICGFIGFGIGASGNSTASAPQSLAQIPFRCLYAAEAKTYEAFYNCRYVSMKGELYQGENGCSVRSRKDDSNDRCYLENHVKLEYEALQALIKAQKEASEKQN